MAKKQNPPKGFERRRYERVALNLDWGKARPLLGAQVLWPNQETSEVYDMSYQGLALMRPGLVELERGQSLTLRLVTPLNPEVEILSKVAWFNADVVGVELKDLSVEARSVIDDFLEDRLIGKHLRSIDRQHFKSGESFTHWYHGPKSTNIYLWITPQGELERARLEIDGQHIVFEDGELQGAGLELLQVDSELRVELGQNSTPIKRAREMLSQLESQQGPIKRLLEVLSRAP